MPTPPKLLRITLALLGLALIVIGLNTALGGMTTLGLQFPPDVLQPTDPLGYARHDSNARFFAGAFTGLGILIGLGALAPRPLAPAIIAALLAIALGGFARLLQPGYSPLTDSALLGSVLFELIACPALAFWLFRSTR